ncbi:uncharacterized protein EAF02_006764 [Botrytis sinoallii]|uniref:uncharacterized protein n=1 Tax=Botrytis sinoallii TaxID=1463999 RepID=UPI001900984B|nr:uncharacterized protein EAF02_006764 [Botrytis sinoallii]KAF7880873.1 hypothetical protein EAF02_006764 [Botrytis sinoallii]
MANINYGPQIYLQNYASNPHHHNPGAPCAWETTESYQRKWSFPAVRILHRVPEVCPAGEHCNDGTIAWETCTQLDDETPLRVGPGHAQHTGYCITRKIGFCKYWKSQQSDPFVCCYHLLTRVEAPMRKGYCFGENCPGLEGAKSIPVVNYDPAAYYSGERLKYERERLDLLEVEAETGKDVRFHWKNMDGPGYETFEEENLQYKFGFQGRNRVSKPVMSYMPNDSWWRPH